MDCDHGEGGCGGSATMEPGPMGLSDIGAVGREYPQFGKSVWNVGRRQSHLGESCVGIDACGCDGSSDCACRRPFGGAAEPRESGRLAKARVDIVGAAAKVLDSMGLHDVALPSIIDRAVRVAREQVASGRRIVIPNRVSLRSIAQMSGGGGQRTDLGRYVGRAGEVSPSVIRLLRPGLAQVLAGKVLLPIGPGPMRGPGDSEIWTPPKGWKHDNHTEFQCVGERINFRDVYCVNQTCHPRGRCEIVKLFDLKKWFCRCIPMGVPWPPRGERAELPEEPPELPHPEPGPGPAPWPEPEPDPAPDPAPESVPGGGGGGGGQPWEPSEPAVPTWLKWAIGIGIVVGLVIWFLITRYPMWPPGLPMPVFPPAILGAAG